MEFDDKKSRLMAKIFRTCILIHIGVILASIFSSNFSDIYFMMLNILFATLNVSTTNCALILSFLEVAFKLFPSTPYIVGEIILYELIMKYNEVEREKITYLLQKRESKLNSDKIIIENIVSRMEDFSKTRQIELLNYIKDIILGNNINKGKYVEIDLLDEESLEELIYKVEEIVYPSYNDDLERDYTRKKTNNNNSINY